MTISKDIIGKRYGRLTVIGKTDKRGKRGFIIWECKCDCGSTSFVQTGHLNSGHTQSCGCLLNESRGKSSITHGGTIGGAIPEYNIWIAMKDRCTNKNDEAYKNYGGRGIRVCDRWAESYSNFISDMGLRPSPKHSIDRKDNDGDYEPSNCRWATKKEQDRNRRNNIKIIYKGRSMVLGDFAKKYGIRGTLVYYHIQKRTPEQIIEFYKKA